MNLDQTWCLGFGCKKHCDMFLERHIIAFAILFNKPIKWQVNCGKK
jgi:hypothetical protein